MSKNLVKLIPEKYEKLIISLRTAQVREYSLEKKKQVMMIC